MSQFQNIVVLTGAGISAESGIPTFRASDGLWENHHVEDVATPEGFAANPQLVHQFYNARREAAKSAQPNPAHIALADFETAFSGNYLLVTQNVDTLHERAGSKSLIHMHGQLEQMKCTKCEANWAFDGDSSIDDKCPHCNKQTTRPDIVWFGEMPYQMENIWAALDNCDLFVAIGTSGSVYPAAGFAQIAARKGAQCVELNLEPSNVAGDFTDGHYGLASDIVPRFFSKLL